MHIPEELDDEDAAVHPIDVLKQMFPDVPEEVRCRYDMPIIGNWLTHLRNITHADKRL